MTPAPKDLDALISKARYYHGQVRHYRARAENKLNTMRRYDDEEWSFHAGRLLDVMRQIGERTHTGLPPHGATDEQIAEFLGAEVQA